MQAIQGSSQNIERKANLPGECGRELAFSAQDKQSGIGLQGGGGVFILSGLRWWNRLKPRIDADIH